MMLLEDRIRRGDYAFREFPSERDLAEETGVARMTARKALLKLVQKKVLTRGSDGRLKVNGKHRLAAKLHVGLLVPGLTSADAEAWRREASVAATKVNAVIRPIYYTHWNDVSLREAMNGFGGLFLVPSPDPMPAWVLKWLRHPDLPVVVLDSDMTSEGLPSINLFPSASVQRLLNHLYKLGHRQIDCLNSMPVNAVIEQRIQQWQLWCEAHGVKGRLIDKQGALPETSYAAIRDLLQAGRFDATALLCTTVPTAMGTLRAFRDFRIEVGRDVSVCGVNGEGIAKYQCPSITALERMNTVPYLTACLKWMARGGKDWVGPLLIEPAEVPLFVGESTGPAPKRK